MRCPSLLLLVPVSGLLLERVYDSALLSFLRRTDSRIRDHVGSCLTSSPGSADGAPGTTANGSYEVDRVFLKDWYGDTTWRAQFVAGKCLEEADSTHFVTERSAPWESCF
jgi:hypothetical protein